MTTEDEVMRLLRRADPDRGRADAPAVDGTDYLAALRTRSTTVTLIDIEPAPTQPEGRHRWPIIAVAAAAVVAIVVGAVMLAARDDSEPQVPADTPPPSPPTSPTPRQPPRRSLAASSTPTSPTTPTKPSPTSPRVPSQQCGGRWRSSEGISPGTRRRDTRSMVSDCELLDDDPEAGVTLRCGFDFHQLGSDALGIGPYRRQLLGSHRSRRRDRLRIERDARIEPVDHRDVVALQRLDQGRTSRRRPGHVHRQFPGRQAVH